MPGGMDGLWTVGHALTMRQQLSHGGEQLLQHCQALREPRLSEVDVRVPCLVEGRLPHQWPGVFAWPSVQASSRLVYSRSVQKRTSATLYADVRERKTPEAPTLRSQRLETPGG